MLFYHNKKEPRKFHTHETQLFLLVEENRGGFYDGGCPKFLNFFKIKFYDKNIFFLKLHTKMCD
jgi:hypothetical protein